MSPAVAVFISSLLLACIKSILPILSFLSLDEFNIDGDFIESQAFAYLAIRSFLNLPISFPNTTGCKSPSEGGILVENF